MNIFKNKFERKANKYLNPKQKGIITRLSHFRLKKQSRGHLYWLLHIKPKLRQFWHFFSFLDRMPKSALFVVLFVFVFLVLMVNQHIMRQVWMNTIVEIFPDLTTSGVDAEGKVQLSPIDAIFTPSVARVQGLFWLFFWVMLGIIYGQIARGYVPRKPQTLPNVRRIRG